MASQTVISHNPYVIVAPYLPLKKSVNFAGWTAGPLDVFAGQWKDGAFEKGATSFISKFRDVNRQQIKKPTLIARTDAGPDGRFPGEKELGALQLAMHFGTLNANPNWEPDSDGAWVSSSDNSEVWAQPIDVHEGHIALERGSLITVTSGGGKTDDSNFEIPAPLELHLPPLDASFDAEAADAIYRVAVGEHDSIDAPLARRISTAVRWLAKAWRNTPSLGPEDRIVMLRTAFEALTGTSEAQEAINGLEATFGAVKGLGATADSTRHMLWSPDETPHRDFKALGRGSTKTFRLSDLGHWYSTFGSARHQVVHEGLVPSLSYNENGSRYNGPLFHVGERLLREAVTAALARFGYVSLWQDEWGRVTEAVLARLASREQDESS